MHIGEQRALDNKPFSVRDRQVESRAVKAQPPERSLLAPSSIELRVTVGGVANDRVVEVANMPSNLVKAPGLGVGAEQ